LPGFTLFAQAELSPFAGHGWLSLITAGGGKTKRPVREGPFYTIFTQRMAPFDPRVAGGC